jgi:hypothetical protein
MSGTALTETKVLLGGFRAWRKEEVRALGDVTAFGEGAPRFFSINDVFYQLVGASGEPAPEHFHDPD